MDRLTSYSGPRVLAIWQPDHRENMLLLEADTNGVFLCPPGQWTLDPGAYLAVRRFGGRLVPARG